MQTRSNDYWKHFGAPTCSLELAGATKEEVLDELVEVFLAADALPRALAAPARRALLEREGLATTGVGHQIAIPHVKLKGLEQALFGLSLHRAGVEWHAPDGEPVRIFFTVLRPERPGDRYDPDRHREMMSWIAALVRQADFRRFAVQVQDKAELLDLVKEMSARLS